VPDILSACEAEGGIAAGDWQQQNRLRNRQCPLPWITSVQYTSI